LSRHPESFPRSVPCPHPFLGWIDVCMLAIGIPSFSRHHSLPLALLPSHTHTPSNPLSPSFHSTSLYRYDYLTVWPCPPIYLSLSLPPRCSMHPVPAGLHLSVLQLHRLSPVSSLGQHYSSQAIMFVFYYCLPFVSPH